MSCDCNKIGGPWISFDPNCPAHGYEAQREAQEREEQEIAIENERNALYERIRILEEEVKKLKKA